jgi:hypothetical protein
MINDLEYKTAPNDIVSYIPLKTELIDPFEIALALGKFYF